MNGQKARPDPDYAFMRADFGEMNKLRRVLYSTTIIFLLSASARAETLEGDSGGRGGSSPVRSETLAELPLLKWAASANGFPRNKTCVPS
jgi:hypothetical protein